MLQNIFKRNQDGWIFIDALVGMIIVATALTALLLMYTQATKGTTNNRNYNNAIYVAQRSLEDIKQYEGTSTIKALPTNVIDPPTTTVDGVTYTVHIGSLTVSDSLDTHINPYQATVSWTDTTISPAVTRSINVAAYYYSN